MKVIEKKTTDLIPYVNNSKEHPENQISQIAASIKEFGFNVPILVDSENSVIAGNGRLLAAQKLKLKKVPCIQIDHLSETQKKAFVIADNKLNLNTGFNAELLDLELKNILENEPDFDLNAIGFDASEIDSLLAGEDEIVEGKIDDDEIPKVEESICQLGQVWKLGDHRLMCGDSTKKEDVDALMNGEKADMVFTDPPYNIAYDFNNNGMVQTGQRTARFKGIKNDNMSDDDFDKFVKNVFERLHENMKEGSSYYISAGRESTQVFNRILKDLDFHIQSWLIWKKENFNISRLDYHPKHEIITYGWKKGSAHNWYSDRSQTDVLEFKREIGSSVHPTQKPVCLLEYLINNSSKKNEFILDLFGGSGSTLITCEKINRKCYSMELDPHYCDVIIKRWEEFTGKKAVLLNE